MRRVNEIGPVWLWLLASTVYVTAACTPGDAEPALAAGDRALGDPVPMTSPAGLGAGEPFLSRASAGVLMSWLEPVEGGHALKFAILRDSVWSGPRLIAEGTNWFVNWADFPSIIELPDGSLAAHWLERSGRQPYAYDVRISFSADGESWTRPTMPHTDGTLTEHGFVSLFPWAGRLGAVWLDGRETGGGHGHAGAMTLRFGTLDRSGVVSDEALLDARVCDCCQTAVAQTSSGPVVAYRDRSADEIRDISVTRLVAGAWTPPQTVHADNWEIAACPVNGPAIAAAGERVAVAWFTGAQDSARVRLAFSDDAGATFGAPVRIDGGDPAGRVDVLLLEDGSAVVSWLEHTDSGAEVRVRHVSRSGLGDPVTVARSSGERASGFPRMVRDGAGLVFAWTRPGDPAEVRTARLPLMLPGR
ncbi:MAG: hypothetical protein ACRELD_08605 [Longimicrobiales bacterium]